MPDNTKQISDIEIKLQRKIQHLKELQQSIEKDKKNLDRLKKYKTLDDCANIGLHNKICQAPYAKCALHNCLLSYRDIRIRKCVMKMCKHLEDIEWKI